jgi:hypothetical protein
LEHVYKFDFPFFEWNCFPWKSWVELKVNIIKFNPRWCCFCLITFPVSSYSLFSSSGAECQRVPGLLENREIIFLQMVLKLDKKFHRSKITNANPALQSYSHRVVAFDKDFFESFFHLHSVCQSQASSKILRHACAISSSAKRKPKALVSILNMHIWRALSLEHTSLNDKLKISKLKHVFDVIFKCVFFFLVSIRGLRLSD